MAAENVIDWVGIAGIVGTLGGVGLGAFGTYKIQQLQLSHENETRFHDQRMDAYIKFASNINRTVSTWQTGNHDTEAVNDILQSFEEILLIGSSDVCSKATQAHGLVLNLFVRTDRSNIPADDMHKLNLALANFRNAARQELNINL